MDLRHFLVVLAIVSQLAPASLSQTCIEELQYPHNGRCCDLCPPGYFKVKDCTRNRSTKCKRCEDGYYLEHPNFKSRCIRCRSCSARANMEEKTPCRRDQNRVCQCKQGYYIPPSLFSVVCIKHMDCPPGEGVDKRGTRLLNTVCTPCAPGTFSNKESSRQKCKPWTDCALLGREEVEPGTSKRNAICGAELTITTQSFPPLKSTVRSKSTTMAASTTSTSSRSKTQSVFSAKSTMSTSTTSSSDSAPLSKSTFASTTATPSKPQSPSDPMFTIVPWSSSIQSVSKMSSSPTKPITPDIKTLITKAKTMPSPTDEGISDSSNSSTTTTTKTPGPTTATPASTASAHWNRKTDQRSTTPQSPTVTITQPKTSVSYSYLIQFIEKAKPVTTPATYTTTEMAEQKKGTNTEQEPGVRNNGVQGNALQIAMIVTLPCLTLIAIISHAAIVIIWFRKKNTSKRKDDLPPVHFNNKSKKVTIGTLSQGEDGMGGSGTSDNNSSGAVHFVEVHETANPTNTAEDENSPLIPFSEATLPCEVPDTPITEADLAKLAPTIGPGWDNAGIQVLGITSADLDTFKANFPINRNMQIFHMLKLWKKKQGKRAVTLRTLCQLLTQAEIEYCVRVYAVHE